MESRLVSKGANMIGEVARCTCPNRQPGMSSMFSQVCQPEFPGTHVYRRDPTPESCHLTSTHVP